MLTKTTLVEESSNYYSIKPPMFDDGRFDY